MNLSRWKLARYFVVFGCLAVVLCLLPMACSPPSPREESRGVQLLLNTETLEPTTTFELRFDDVVASDADIGKPSEPSPLLSTPPLAGKFVWLSRRSGVFTPSAPPSLGQSYAFTLRAGLRGTNGQSLKARLHRQFVAPPFDFSTPRSLGFHTNNAPARPTVPLLFNAGVNAEAVRWFLEFRSASGQRIEAQARPAKVNEYFFGESGKSLTWAQRFAVARAEAKPSDTPLNRRTARHIQDAEESGERPVAVFTNRLVVTPAVPLPVGDGWRLVLAKGLPSSEVRAELARSRDIFIGNVTPFTLVEARTHNGLRDGKNIELRFSKSLSDSLNADQFAQWFSLIPAVSNLTVNLGGDGVRLHGDFSLTQRYTIGVRAGLPGEKPFALERTVKRELTFEPLPPRLYFPAFSTELLAGGRRQFELVSVNVPDIQVRGKLLNRETLIHALRGYRSYFKESNNRFDREDYQEPFKEIDFNVLPGRTLPGYALLTGAALDVPARTSLDLPLLLQKRRHAAFFLSAERTHEDASRSRLGTQALVQLTDLGLMWKHTDEQMFAYVFSYETGLPVAGATVRLLTDDNEVVVEKTTDAQGIVELSDDTVPGDDYGKWLMVEKDDDLHAVSLADRRWGNELPLWNFGLPTRWRDEGEEEAKPQVFLFSDRSVYRPGETVYLKAIARQRHPEELTVVQGPVRIQCIDARDQTFFTTNLVFSKHGSFALSLPLPKGALGQYHVQVGRTNGEFVAHYSFSVQEFRPNAFELTVSARPVYNAGEKLAVPVMAKYLFGAALTKAKLSWSLEAEDVGFTPAGFEKFNFCNHSQLNEDRNGSFEKNDEVELGGAQPFVLEPELPLNPRVPQPRHADLLLEVTDLNQQTISRGASFTRHAADFYLGVRGFKDLIRAGEPLPIEVIAVRADGTPLTEPGQATLKVFKVEYHSVRVLGAGGAVQYRNEMELKLVTEREVPRQPAVREDAFAPTQARTNSALFTPKEAGSYLLEVTTKDSAGRAVVTKVSFYATQNGQAEWNYRNGAQIDLIADHKLYHAGDTALILAKTPISGHALVTVERGTVLRSFVTNFTGNAPVFSVPILASDAPNVFVSVLLLRGHAASTHQIKEPEQRLGYVQLNIEQPETKLRVQVLPDATDYRPGQRVTVTAEITSHDGQPVREAEVTLYAVDEGILSLTGYATPKPHAFFHTIRPLGVRTHSSLANLLREDPERLSFENKGYLIGGGGRGKPRKDFLPCAYWNAALVTDTNGKVTASFSAPDSLTRYRIIAVVHADTARFGHGESNFQVNKPLSVEPALPAFARLGDQLIGRAVVHNLTQQAGEIEVTLELDFHARTKETKRRVKVAANTSGVVEFPLECVEIGDAKWTWQARFVESREGNFTDAVESRLTVGHVAPLLREVLLGRSQTAETNLLLRANPQLLEGKGTATVRISNTRLTELNEAIEHLLHYPYGCVEQTSSSLLPWLVLGEFTNALPTLRASYAKSGEVIERGVNRLFTMQTASGGLAYWPGGREPMLWGSAYGGLVLALAERHGHAPPRARMDDLLKYLSAELRHAESFHNNEHLSDRCLALYALAVAGRAEPAYHELIFKQRAVLSSESRAVLALAITESKGPVSMVAELLKPEKAPEHGELWFGCAQREIATRLMAWCQFRPTDNHVDVLVEELMQSQRGAHWHTTQGNAWALLALSNYVVKVERARQPTAGSLARASERAEFQLDTKAATFERVFPLALATAQTPLTLANPQTNLLFTQVTLEARARVGRQPRQDRGYAIARRYDLVGDDGTLREYVKARVGDRVLVTLRIEVRAFAHYLAIDDPLPSVFEPLNPEFKSQQTRAGEALGADWVSDFRELRTDRALFFRDHLPPGNYTIRYLARVRAAGTTAAPAAKIEEMYHPERFGLTETTEVVSLPLE